MSLAAALATALVALWKNALRSLLATLGILIAVAAVVTTVGLGEGAREKVAEEMASLGTNLLYLTAGSDRRGKSARAAGRGSAVTRQDGDAVAAELGHMLAAISPVVFHSAQAVYGNANWTAQLAGVHASYLEVRRWQVETGSFFDPQDCDNAAKVCVLGQTVAKKLFGTLEPVGEMIRVDSLPCRVVGTLRAKGQTGWGQDQDDVIVMPFETVTRRLFVMHHHRGLMFGVAARSPELAGPLQAAMTDILRQRHRLGADEDDDFSIYNFSEMQTAADRQMRTATLLVTSVALISLLVGAIGITNVMLVSVVERTREIGIRMAVGARQVDILVQFLIEAALLAGLGGLLGVASGCAATAGAAGWLGWRFVPHLPVMILAPCAAATIGIVAGFYPALRASGLDPIDALRHE